MPRRKQTSRKTLGFDKTGRYFRNLGYVRSAAGKYSQKKFYLGYDEDLAKLAVARLESLWKRVEELHAAAMEAKLTPRRHEFPPLDYADYQSPEPTRAVWTELPLFIAESIRQGEHVARIPFDRATILSGVQERMSTAQNLGVPKMAYYKPGLEGVLNSTSQVTPNDPFAPSFPAPTTVDKTELLGSWLDSVRRWFPVVHIEIDDLEINDRLENRLLQEGKQLIEEGMRLTAEPLTNHKLHHAIEVYKAFLIKEKVDTDGETSEWAKAKSRQIRFVADHTADLDLAQLGKPSIDAILKSLSDRPVTKKGKHCSVRHAQNCMKEFRKFLEWLDKSESFNWRFPIRFEFETPKVTRKPLNPTEEVNPILLRKKRTYVVGELKTLYEYAEPLQRLYLLFGLNFGFGNAELISLRTDEIFLNQAHPDEDLFEFGSNNSQSWIARQRTKTQVLNTWKIWPETYAAIQWWQGYRDKIVEELKLDDNPAALSAKQKFLLTQNGKPLATKVRRTGAIPNSWNALNIRISDHEKDFKVLSFGKLRKTGASIVRKLAGAEIASVYLAHGKPYGQDKDLEAYADRPYGKLFDALDDFHKHLQPLWKSVENPFSDPRRLGGKSNLSPKTKKAIAELSNQGMSAKHIAKQLSLNVSTVYRHKPVGQ